MYLFLDARVKLEVINPTKHKTIQVKLIQTSIFQPLAQWYICQTVAMQWDIWRDKLAIDWVHLSHSNHHSPIPHTYTCNAPSPLRFTRATIISTYYNWAKIEIKKKKKNFKVHQQSHADKNFLDRQVNYLKWSITATAIYMENIQTII